MLAYGFVDVYMGSVMLLPAHAGMEKHSIPGVISSGRSTGARAPRVSRRRSYRLLRAHAENTRRQGGKGEGARNQTGPDTTRPDSSRGARRPRPELQSGLTVIMLGLT